MIYTSQYDDALFDDDSLGLCVGNVNLEQVCESHDYSYVIDLDDVV